MSETIKINEQDVSIKEYNGQRVITFKDIDRVHKRPEGTAKRNFRASKKHLKLGVDYIVRNSSEAKNEYGVTAPNGLNLITESGYLMLVKSFTDDLAWEVQRQLVNTYFKAKTLLEYHPKMTSLGEIASYIKVVTRFMKEQGSTPEQIMQAIDDINVQFGIKLPRLAKVNPWEQMTVICIRQ